MKNQSTLIGFLTSFCFFLFCSFLSAQIKFEDFGFYYILDDKIKDVRTNKDVIPNFTTKGRQIYYPDNKVLAQWDRDIVFFDNMGKKISTFSFGYSTLSPDWKSILYMKESDIWHAKVDYKTGKQYGDKRLTQLGIFYNNIDVVNWYEDNVIFRYQVNNKLYQLNVSTGEISESYLTPSMIGLFTMNRVHTNFYLFPDKNFSFNRLSPSRRYIVVSNIADNSVGCIFDMKFFSFIPLKTNISLLDNCHAAWINDTIAVVNSGVNGYDEFEKTFYKITATTGDVLKLYLQPEDYSFENFNYESLLHRNEVSRNISLKQNYIMVPYASVLFGNGGSRYMAYNLNYSEMIELQIDFAPYVYDPNYLSNSYYEWVTDEAFIFRQQGDILTQGTWLFNLKTKEKKKLTPFLLEKVVLLSKANKIVFIANRYLFMSDH